MNLGATGGDSFSFDHPGATVQGAIVSMEPTQQTDMQTNEPKTFSDGSPMMMFRVELATDLRDPGNQFDTGSRTVFLKGSRKPESQSSLAAVLSAVQKATGTTNLAQGGLLTLTYVGDGVAKNRGFNPPKLYEAVYVPPSTDLAATQAAPVAQAAAPAVQSAAPQVAAPAAQAPGLTPDQLAAMQAAGIDPAQLAAAQGVQAS